MLTRSSEHSRDFESYLCQKKVVLFPEIGQVKIFLSLTRPHRISPENRLKKYSGHPGEDFSSHPHFQKQEYYFFDLTFQIFWGINFRGFKFLMGANFCEIIIYDLC